MSALAFLRAVARRLVLASSRAVFSRFLLALVRAVARVSAVDCKERVKEPVVSKGSRGAQTKKWESVAKSSAKQLLNS
jgi:hypothetical protein